MEATLMVCTHHTRHAPYVGASTPLRTENDFWGSILPCLDVVCKMMPDPASVTQIGDLDGDYTGVNFTLYRRAW